MNEFKVGDKVTCVDNQYLDHEIKEGWIYTIKGFLDDGVYLEETKKHHVFNLCRFKLTGPEFIGKHPHYEVKFPGGTQAPKFNHSGSKYLRDIKTTIDGKIDVYAVLIAFNVVSPARQHAIKKLLCAGIRGKNNELNDIQEAKDAIERDIQLLNI